MTLYKVLNKDRSPIYGSGVWTPRRWRSVQGELVPCERGIHYCRPDQVVRWLGPAIWTFEDGTPGETIDAVDKMVTRKGRILERVDSWNESTARLFAADCAEAVLPIFERERPNDDRPRRAVEAARLFARGEIDAAARDAARDAAGAATRAAARDAARAAARAATWDAARAATWAATWDAAGAATRAAAGAAARAAARAATRAAARDAARDAQTVILFDYLEGRRS